MIVPAKPQIKNSNSCILSCHQTHNLFRMLICGVSGCGKTNTLYHMLMKPLLYYDEIYLYARNLEQDKYKSLMKKMRDLSYKFGYEILHVSNDEINPIKEMEYEDNQKIVIFDDYVCDKNQRQIIDYFIQGRHKNCSVIYLSQSFYKTPKDIRLNCSHYCLYEFPSSREANRISSELGVDKEVYKVATREPFSFLFVDKPKKRIAKNFTGNI